MNEELNGIEEDLKGIKFKGMEGRGSVVVNNPGEVGNFQLHFGNGQFIGGLNGMVIVNGRW